MKLSIVIPIYNSIKNLQRCLDSVLESPFTDLECIMVNDGSEDSSEVLCKTYADADRRFVYIRKDQGGKASAKNSGLAHSRGKYLMFLSPDDYLLKESWDRIAEVIHQDQVDFTAFSYQYSNEYGETDYFRYPMKGEKSVDFADICHLTFTTDIFQVCTGVLFDYEIIRKMKMKFQTDNPIYEDQLFISEYLQHCKTGQLLNRPVLVHQKTFADMLKYSSSQRIDFLANMYRFQSEQAGELIEKMQSDFHQFYFKGIRDIMTDLAKELAGSDLKESYADILHHEFVHEFLLKTDGRDLTGFGDKIILHSMKKKSIFLLTWILNSKAKHK